MIAINYKLMYNYSGDSMNIDITRLNNDIDKRIDVSIKHKFTKEELEGTDLIECDCNVIGTTTRNSLREIVLDLNVNGTMVLPCAITLKPTKIPYNIEINGSLRELLDKNEEKFTNTLDIFPIIWENILMEIPMRVVSPEAETVDLKGDGWKLVTEEEETSSPLAELEDLLKDR